MSKIGKSVGDASQSTEQSELMPVKFGGTLGTLKVTFIEGGYNGCVYKIPGDRLSDGRFVVYPNTMVKRVLPNDQKLSIEDSRVIIDLIKPYTSYVEVR